MPEAPTAWAGDWMERLTTALHARGYPDFRSLAANEPGKSLHVLASELSGAFAPIQLAIAMGLEAKRDGWTDWYARDMLIRFIAHICPNGWASQKTNRFDKAHALAAWTATLESGGLANDSKLQETCRRILNDAPGGWNPVDPHDLFLSEVLSSVRFSNEPSHQADPAVLQQKAKGKLGS